MKLSLCLCMHLSWMSNIFFVVARVKHFKTLPYKYSETESKLVVG